MYEISAEEMQTGVVEPAKLAAIVEDIRTAGFAAVAGLVSEETCSRLAAAVQEDAETIRQLGEPTAHERLTGQGHLQLGLRRHAPFVTADLVANPAIEAIVAGVLGRGAWLGFYNGNVNCPGSTYQPLHMDRPFSWKTPEDAARAGHGWPPPTTSLGCSIALEEITEENGATEVYPGTHRATEVIELLRGGSRLEEHPALLEKWGPPARMTIPAGGAVIRDPRMWHRGVPNPSDRPRAMIAVTYHSALGRHWRGRLVKRMSEENLQRCEAEPHLRVMDDGSLGDGRLLFQDDVREVFEAAPNRSGIDRNARFVDAPQRVNHFLDPQGLGGARIVDDPVLSAEGA
jgi:ectoine hydroxylase-related dioxygenase (phytanoyl-CoA dioxygenase family)